MAGRELKQLFRAYREGDELAFRRVAQEIIADEEAKNHLALARDLRRIMTGGGQAAVAETVVLPAPPTDREGDWPLADIRHPERTFADIVLAEDLTARLSALVSEVTKWEQLDYHGIPRRQRILFHGPPGCGKTSVAEAIAAELGWPLLVVRLVSMDA